MTTALGSLLLFLQLPPPPGTDSGNGGSEWWRILAVLIVTVLTVGLFAWIFKPSSPTQPNEPPPGPTPDYPRSATPEFAGNLVPFRERTGTPTISETDFTTAAATERLRRLTTRDQPSGSPQSERRRLGGRRLPPAEAHLPGSPTPTAPPPVTPGITPEEETPVEQSQINTTPPAFIPLPVDDLLGDVANQPLPPDTKPYETMRGDVPTESEIQQMAPDSPSSAKILPFAPRTTRPAEPATPASTPASDDYEQILAQASSDQFAPTPIGIDVATREGISATVQELLFCANVGEFMHGFALYTDRYLFQFMTESGFDEDSFRETFSAIPGKEPQDWTRIENIVAARRLDDGRVTADVTYLDQRHPVAPERFTFKLDVITGRWLIDGIAPVSG